MERRQPVSDQVRPRRDSDLGHSTCEANDIITGPSSEHCLYVVERIAHTYDL